jgi:hypothetical protein
MANYYTNFCAPLNFPSAAAAAAAIAAYEAVRDVLDADLVSMGFNLVADAGDETGCGLLVTDQDGSADLESVEKFVLGYGREYQLTGSFVLQWADICDRHRPDSFGGGVLFIDLEAGATKLFTSTNALLKACEADQPHADDEDWPVAGFYTVAAALHDRVCYSPAEGGCYCDVYDLDHQADMPRPSVHGTLKSALAAKEKMDMELEPWNEGRPEVSSVNSIGRYVAYIHDGFPKSQPERLPTYE